MGLFETEALTQPENLSAVTDLCGRWIDVVHRRKPIGEIILDMDSSVSQTYGQQEGSAYNGQFGCTCYHPHGQLGQAPSGGGEDRAPQESRRAGIPARGLHCDEPAEEAPAGREVLQWARHGRAVDLPAARQVKEGSSAVKWTKLSCDGRNSRRTRRRRGGSVQIGNERICRGRLGRRYGPETARPPSIQQKGALALWGRCLTPQGSQGFGRGA